MYTRFKNQKSGLKLGINTISSSRKVVLPTSTATSTQTGSISNSISSSSSVQSLNSNDSIIKPSKSRDVSPLSSPTSLFSSVLAVSTGSIVLVDDNNNEKTFNDLKPNDNNIANLKSTETTQITVSSSINEKNIIPIQFNGEGLNLVKKSKSSNKKESIVKNVVEEPVDQTCISYVKSMWEKYSSEIGKQDGPLRHVDENSQYPHLNGFVAFDMEHWWAERSISSMINEKSLSLSNENLCVKNNTTKNNKIKNTTKKETDLILNSTLKFKLPSTGSQQAKLSSITPLNSLNNFQLCFS